jgi:hypothetical protein
MLEFLLKLIQGRSARLALSSLIIATVLAVVSAGFFTGGSFKNLDIPKTPYALSFSFAYVLFFFIIWFILYIQDRAENEDGFTQVRKKLVGEWFVRYGSPSPEKTLQTDKSAVSCVIWINPGNRKLELKFKIVDNKIYQNDESQIVKVISLRREEAFSYILFYYFKGERKIQPLLANFIEHESDERSSDTVELEFMAKLNFEANVNQKQVQAMNGEWYDLNGNISRLLSLHQDVTHWQDASPEDGKTLEKRKLSEIEIPSFSAMMGSINFGRG